MMDRPERHNGSVGDCYVLVDASAAEYAKHRAGNVSDGFIELREEDVIMRTAHTGDCFCDYAVFRGGARLTGRWYGYDGVGKYIGNVNDDMVTLPLGRWQAALAALKKGS